MAFPSIPESKGQGNKTTEVQPRQLRGCTEMKDDDDDIQDYVRPWVGLTDVEIVDIMDAELTTQNTEHFALCQAIEAKLKEKNT